MLKGDQAQAFEQIKMFIQQPTSGMLLLTGAAGTGKSFLTREIIEYYLQEHPMKKVIVTAPTHPAVKVIKNFNRNVNAKFSTIHSALALREYVDGYGKINFKRKENAIVPLLDYHLLIVDEASQIQDPIFEDILDFLDVGLKIIFVGDVFQIPPVGQKTALVFDKEVREEYNIQMVTLNEIIRQKEGHPIITLAHKLKKAIFRPIAIIDPQNDTTPLGEVRYVRREEENELLNEILPVFASDQYKHDSNLLKIIAWRNTTVDHYNKIVREFIYGENAPRFVEGEKLIVTTRPVTEANQVLISINEEMQIFELQIKEQEVDEDLILKYYQLGVRVEKDDSQYDQFSIKVIHEDSEKDYNEIVEVLKKYAQSHKQGSTYARSAWMDYFEFQKPWAQVNYNYAITAHKCQGSTYINSVVNMWDSNKNRNIYEKNRVFYTACTRSSYKLYIVI